MSQKELKEAFVSHLNGTSLMEVTLGSSLAPLCFLNRGLLLILCDRGSEALPKPTQSILRLLFDYTVVIAPLVLSCTILSDILFQVVISLSLISMCMLVYICLSSTHSIDQQPKAFFESHLQFERVPFVTNFRVFVILKTSISILAVDFAIFPRRFAKTETYGTGVMDYGVGGFVFANALVCSEARGKGIMGSKFNYITKQLVSVWPLVALGMGRLISVKMTGYQEHVTEYGVHWNFFFTLALVRVSASIFLAIMPVNLCLIFALLIAVMYQFILDTTGLKEFIVLNNDRDLGFLHANKEGIFSAVGYVAIYLAGVHVGVFIMQQRVTVKEWLRALIYLLMSSLGLYAAVCLCQVHLEPVSRRLANLPFCFWSIAQSLFFLTSLGLADLLLLFSKKALSVDCVPSSWSLYRKKEDLSPLKNKDDLKRLCLFQAVNRNMLIFFLLANVITGATNSVVDTLNCTKEFSVYVLLSYMFLNCFVIYVLHIFGITLKFW
ncbi:phosphatidylinositol-glycan biosynthesis class W protein [Boleophthalmus pectinirostris]|uniref:phosphatidylinositol-glycan biosynthesis class W protein n=1 Tax=Boleophthalmus pectinirostris TaxID=150288 RepID=UPI000A1C253A|nr:phosphatidylinositol-glycan biosynthesis class W protein [Boleophthalmus pectinirostris]